MRVTRSKALKFVALDETREKERERGKLANWFKIKFNIELAILITSFANCDLITSLQLHEYVL